MKRKLIQTFLQTTFIFILVLISCRKQENNIPKNGPNSFFDISLAAPEIIVRIADTIRKQNKRGDFLSRIVKTEGSPQWDHADIITNRFISARDNNTDTCVIIPLVLGDTKYVNSVLICNVSTESIKMSLVQGRYYHMYGFNNQTDTIDANMVAYLMMYYDFKLFGNTEFSIWDTRLFHDTADTSNTDRNNNTSSRDVILPGDPLVGHTPPKPYCVSIVYLGVNGSVTGVLDPNCPPVFIPVTDPPFPGGTGGGSGYGAGNYGPAGSNGGISGSAPSNWPVGVCTNSLPATPPPPGVAFPRPCAATIPVTPKVAVNLYDPERPFENLDHPIDVPDGPYLYNGISISDVPPGAPQGTPRLIATTNNRGNIEDLQYGFDGDVSGISESEVKASNENLFEGMSSLFNSCTFFDNDLSEVGKQMIQKFRTNTSNSSEFTNPMLNNKVKESATMVTFLKTFGNTLRDLLTEQNGNINNVPMITLNNTRPIFNTLYYKFHGLQILINDTELTEIQLDHFELSPTKTWEADITVTVYDHFGVDKNDAIKYEKYHSGFADWWLLQHTRGFVPFVTKVTFRQKISGVL